MEPSSCDVFATPFLIKGTLWSRISARLNNAVFVEFDALKAGASFASVLVKQPLNSAYEHFGAVS
jgi:hypothetical protein